MPHTTRALARHTLRANQQPPPLACWLLSRLLRLVCAHLRQASSNGVISATMGAQCLKPDKQRPANRLACPSTLHQAQPYYLRRLHSNRRCSSLSPARYQAGAQAVCVHTPLDTPGDTSALLRRRRKPYSNARRPRAWRLDAQQPRR